MNIKKRRIIYIAVTIMLIAGISLALTKLFVKDSKLMPRASMLVENIKWPIEGYIVGSDYIYTSFTGKKEQFYKPSLQGVWQLDEPYERSTVKIDGTIEYVSISFRANSEGTLFGLPHRIDAVCFDRDVTGMLPSEDLVWADGTEVSLQKHGNQYRIMNPKAGKVYVIRTVWNSGVLEFAWIIDN